MKAKILAYFPCRHCETPNAVDLLSFISEAAKVSLMSPNKSNTGKLLVDFTCLKCKLDNTFAFVEGKEPLASNVDLFRVFTVIEKHLQKELVKKLKEFGFKGSSIKE